MKWLEGWFGTASGVLGILWLTLVSLTVPMNTQVYYGSRACMVTNGVTRCYGPNGSPISIATPGSNVVPVLLIGVTILLFVGVIVGTWLDLRGVRTAGRLILLICATLLIFMPFLVMSATNPINGIAFAYVWPLTLLALVAGVLACVRRDTPRAAASPTLG